MRFFLSPVGRLSRKDWWLKAVPVMLGAFVAAGLIDAWLLGWNFLIGPARLILGAVFLWPTIAVIARRLHDLDWGTAMPVVLLALILLAGPALVFLGVELTGETFNIITFTGVTALLGALCITGFVLLLVGAARGRSGPNRHGPDPLAVSPG